MHFLVLFIGYLLTGVVTSAALSTKHHQTLTIRSAPPTPRSFQSLIRRGRPFISHSSSPKPGQLTQQSPQQSTQQSNPQSQQQSSRQSLQQAPPQPSRQSTQRSNPQSLQQSSRQATQQSTQPAPVTASFQQLGSSTARMTSAGMKSRLLTVHKDSVSHPRNAGASVRVTNDNFVMAQANVSARQTRLKMDLEPGAMARTIVRRPNGAGWFTEQELHDTPGRNVVLHESQDPNVHISAQIEMVRGLGKIKASGTNLR